MERKDLGNVEAAVPNDQTKANDDGGKEPEVVPILSSKYRVRGGADFDSTISSDLAPRKAFVCKVYIILTVWLSISFWIACFFIFIHTLQEWAHDHSWTFIIFVGAFMILFLLIIRTEVLRRRVPLNFILVIVLAILQGFIIGFFSAGFKTIVFMTAFGITIALFIALSLLARCIPRDLTKYWWLTIFIGGDIVCVALIFCLTVWLTELHVVWVVIYAYGVLLLCILLILCTQRLMAGKQESFDEKEYIMGALLLDLAVLLLFNFIEPITSICF